MTIQYRSGAGDSACISGDLKGGTICDGSDLHTNLNVSCTGLGVQVWTSTDQHTEGCVGIFSAWIMEMGALVAKYYFMLVYTALGRASRNTNTSVEGMMEVMVAVYATWDSEIDH